MGALVRLLVSFGLLTSLLSLSLTDADNEVSSDRTIDGFVGIGYLERNYMAKKFTVLNMGKKLKARTAYMCLKKCKDQNWRWAASNISSEVERKNDCRFVQWRHNNKGISTKRRRQCWFYNDFEAFSVKKRQGWTLGYLDEAEMP